MSNDKISQSPQIFENEFSSRSLIKNSVISPRSPPRMLYDSFFGFNDEPICELPPDKPPVTEEKAEPEVLYTYRSASSAAK